MQRQTAIKPVNTVSYTGEFCVFCATFCKFQILQFELYSISFGMFNDRMWPWTKIKNFLARAAILKSYRHLPRVPGELFPPNYLFEIYPKTANCLLSITSVAFRLFRNEIFKFFLISEINLLVWAFTEPPSTKNINIIFNKFPN